MLMFSFVFANNVLIEVDLEDSFRFFFIGLCSFINVVGTVFAIKLIPPAEYAVFQTTIPCISTSISMFVGLESFCYKKSSGIILAVIGASFIEMSKVSKVNSSSFENRNLGLFLVLAQCCGMACLIVFQKPLLAKYKPSLVTLVYYSIGTLITIVICVIFASRFSLSSFYFDSLWMPWFGLGYASVFATFFAYNFYSWAGKRLHPSVTTVYCTLQPVGTGLLSFLVFGSIPSVPQVFGCCLVAAGLFITSFSNSKDSACPTGVDYQYTPLPTSSDVLGNPKVQ